jgi:hypothetical protein
MPLESVPLYGGTAPDHPDANKPRNAGLAVFADRIDMAGDPC